MLYRQEAAWWDRGLFLSSAQVQPRKENQYLSRNYTYIDIHTDTHTRAHRAKACQRAAGFITFHRDWWHPVTWGFTVGFITLEIMLSCCSHVRVWFHVLSSDTHTHTHTTRFHLQRACTHRHTLVGSLVLSWEALFGLGLYCFWGSRLLPVLLFIFFHYIGSAMPQARRVLSCFVNMTLKKQQRNDTSPPFTSFRKVFQSIKRGRKFTLTWI